MFDQPTAHSLQQNEDVDRDADSMVRVGKTPRGAHGHEAQDEEDRAEQHGEDVQVGVVADAVPRAAGVEAHVEHREGHDEEECDSR